MFGKHDHIGCNNTTITENFKGVTSHTYLSKIIFFTFWKFPALNL